jgi:hypothetical protein
MPTSFADRPRQYALRGGNAGTPSFQDGVHAYTLELPIAAYSRCFSQATYE